MRTLPLWICVLLAGILGGCSVAASPTVTGVGAGSKSGTTGGADSSGQILAPLEQGDRLLDAPGSGLRLTLLAEGNEARYRAQEVLARLRVPNEAVGRTKDVSGAITLDSTGTVIPGQSKITVDLRQLASDERLRDRFVRTDVLQTGRFPNAEFVAREIRGIPWPAPATGDFSFQLSGDLTVHGVTRSVTWNGSGRIGGGHMNATATTSVNITDFGMAIPRVVTVLSLEDAITLELDVRAVTG